MSDRPRESAAQDALPLPDAPSLEWLRKRAKRRLAELRASRPDARLADAQRDLARRHGFSSWRALAAHVASSDASRRAFEAAKAGDVAALRALLDAQPGLLQARSQPYEHTLLHAAAFAGRLEVVDLLLQRGLDPNVRERGDETYPMHWAAAAGHVAVVERLIAAGGDVVGEGDDHELGLIGWAACWDGADDDAHRRVAELLVAHGARHHVFSAVALDLADEVRRIAAADPAQLERRMSRNENHQRPLHLAVRLNRPAMVSLLLALGADAGARDDAGHTVVHYAMQPSVRPDTIEALRAALPREELLLALALADWPAAERLWRAAPALARDGALHLVAKRGDAAAAAWLLARGADPRARWSHWGATVTPLHLCAFSGSAEVARLLLDAGADPTVRDDLHDGDALGWAEHFGRDALTSLLRARAPG